MTQKPSPTARDRRSYDVGYGKPPARSRFRTGESGNPSGRPKSPMRLDSILKTELDVVVNLTIGGKRVDISKRKAIVRRLFEKALRGDVRALEIFLQHTRKREAADPRPSHIIKYYKVNLGGPQATQDGKDAGDTKGATSSLHNDGASTAAQPHGTGEGTRSEALENQQVARDDRRIGESKTRDELITRADTAKTGAQPHAAHDGTTHQGSPGIATIQMRAPKPHQHFYVSPVADRSGRYSSDARGLIVDVHPHHVEPLRASGCVRA